MQFATAKTLDYKSNPEALLNHENPFATLVLAHLKTQETRTNPDERFIWKKTLLKNLLRYGMAKDDIRELLSFVDWIMHLSDTLDEQLRTELDDEEEFKIMPYVTSFERLAMRKGEQLGIEKGLKLGRKEGLQKGLEKGREKGIQEGLQEGAVHTTQENILGVLKVRFGKVPAKLVSALKGIDELPTLKDLLLLAAKVKSLDEFSVR